MSPRGRVFLWSGLVLGCPVLVLCIYGLTSGTAPAGPRPPELGGQQAPARAFEIRFDRPYDVYCSAYSEQPLIYRGCKILGFTGRIDDSARAGQESGSFAFSSSSGSGSYSREYFDHWLVLELSDGRQAYVPPSAVKYIEQAAPKAK